jgi:NAD(P)H-hydrate epimerase
MRQYNRLIMSDVPLYTVAQVRAFDRAAIEQHGVAGYELMRRAATAAFAHLRRCWPQARRIGVVCGSGNNGGDGYVLARLARAAGFDVQLVAPEAPRPGGDAEHACRDWIAAGGQVLGGDAALPDADVYVDAIFGTGLTRAPSGAAQRWIEALNGAAAPVLALDVPSGVDADSGNVPGAAVHAAQTISFVAHKRGLFTGAALDHRGDVVLDDLGVPAAVFAAQRADAALLSRAQLRAWLPARSGNVHKGNFGHVLCVGGDAGMGGAIRLAGEAALRVGAGLVSVATRADHVVALNTGRPELMARGVDGPQELKDLLARATVIALGPGLGQRAWGHALWHTALAAGKPTVFDADALNLIARGATPPALPARSVLTPHPGEAARLLGCDTAAIERDRFAAAREIARKLGAVTVLKGAGSLVASAQGDVAVCPWGNPGMASGGMGDVLTGVIAGLLAQGLDAWPAACGGVALHALAGDAAAAAGQAGLVAGDLFAPLRTLRNGLPAA